MQPIQLILRLLTFSILISSVLGLVITQDRELQKAIRQGVSDLMRGFSPAEMILLNIPNEKLTTEQRNYKFLLQARISAWRAYQDAKYHYQKAQNDETTKAMLRELDPPKEEPEAPPPEPPKVGTFARIGKWWKELASETPRTAVAMA